jgi:hypothetical protein
MRAITISQPWASTISDGKKFVENRTWPTLHRGPLAIHAGKGSKYMTARQIRESEMPFASVIATCTLDACIYLNWPDKRIEDGLPSWLTLQEFYNHRHTEGPWCWVLGNVKKLELPIPAKGFQGIWNWDRSKLEGAGCR